MMSPANPQSLIPPAQPLPRWLKRNVPKGNANHFTAKLIGQLGLHTVCDHAKCPNRMECYAQKTATFLILGDICTRGCRFCSVQKGKPQPPDPDEPRRVAEAASQLGLQHVVITCVTRDNLPDGGAEHFVETIAAVREATAATIEVLPSDFAGNAAAVDRLIEAAPEVYNHNTETVPRLYPAVRGKGGQAHFSRTARPTCGQCLVLHRKRACPPFSPITRGRSKCIAAFAGPIRPSLSRPG